MFSSRWSNCNVAGKRKLGCCGRATTDEKRISFRLRLRNILVAYQAFSGLTQYSRRPSPEDILKCCICASHPELEAVGPAAGGVVHARDFDFCPAHAVGDDVGRFGYHEFARTGDAAGCAEFRVFRQQVLDAVEDVQGDARCGGRIMVGDVRAQGDEVVDGFRRPLERHTLLGAGRSLRVSQEATHSLTRSCAMPLPRSSEARALVMPATCHSLVSR